MSVVKKEIDKLLDDVFKSIDVYVKPYILRDMILYDMI
jgi:hypothetical protein